MRVLRDITEGELALYAGDIDRFYSELRAIEALPGGRIIRQGAVSVWIFPVRIEVPVPVFIDIKHHINPNAWMVWLAHGPIKEIVSLMPYPLPLVIFSRDNRLRCYKLERLLALVDKMP